MFMLTREIIDAWSLIDRPDSGGDIISAYFATETTDPRLLPEVHHVRAETGSTEVLRWTLPGSAGHANGGTAPTLAIVGRLGGTGVRPHKEGTVSDSDGAVIAVATALKLVRAIEYGEPTHGDVIIVTHICPDAPTRDHPVRGQMDSPVPIDELLSRFESPNQAAALISVDTTRSHYLLNHSGLAITPTLINGVLMRISDDLMNLLAEVTSEPPVALPITMQDITPMSSGLFRINSIMQPGNYFHGPMIGLASVSRHPIRGTTTGANRPENLETGARFCVEAARRFGCNSLLFVDDDQYQKFTSLYGDLSFLVGRAPSAPTDSGNEE